jgi:hypothetical protein
MPEKEDAIMGPKPAYGGFVDGSVIFCLQDSGQLVALEYPFGKF